MRRVIVLALVLLAPVVAAVAGERQPAYVVVATPAKKVEAVYTFEMRAPNLKADEWVLVAARAPELPSQVKVSASLDPKGKEGRDASDLKQPVLVARIPADTKALKTTVKVRVTTEATLIARRLVPFKPGMTAGKVIPLTDGERKAALAATRRLDHDAKAFQQWLDENKLRRARGENDVDFGRRVFLTIRKTFTYKRPFDHDARATSTCAAHNGDCGCLSTVFVCALRANGIPARELVGRIAESAKHGDADPQCHARAEFYADGVGWVPADPSFGLADDSPAGLEFFGNDHGDLLVLHLDGDLRLDTVHFGKQSLTRLQTLACWATGGGDFDGSETTEGWQVRALALDARGREKEGKHPDP